jgi:hypothetical protein
MITFHAELTEQEWRELARQASREEDTTRLVSIIERLIAKYREWKTSVGSRTREMN